MAGIPFNLGLRMKTIGSIVTYRKGKPPKTSPHGRLPVLSPHYLRTGEIEEMAEPTSKDVVLDGGELILLWDGSNAGEFFRARAGVLSSTMVAFDFDEEATNPDYLYYDLKRFELELKGRTAGSGIPHVDKEVLLSRAVFEGGPREQAAAAKVLLKVDQAIEQTEVLLAKQQRIKTGLMHDLLTRFRNTPHGKAASLSSLEQFGNHIESIDSGWSPVCESEPAREGECGSLKTSAITFSGYDAKQNKRVPFRLSPLPKLFARVDDILITRVGPRERVGVVAHIAQTPEKLMISENMLRIRLCKQSRLLPAFVPLILNSHFVQSEWEKLKVGLAEAQVVITQRSIRETKIPITSPEEQERIVSIHARIQSVLHAHQEHLGKLHRLKYGLMHELLTGTISVTPMLHTTS
ncbi:MAG: restriction endonuclease subunit S [Verrucomicrobiaceae bacterium]|nr:MAG: restriction endonuclease subunit S [Verrucomicrobiaceae bacterium]